MILLGVDVAPSSLHATHKQQIYNRMNGSPGDPPGTHMHKFKPKRITPFIHRLVSDPIGKEAGLGDTNIRKYNDTKYINQHRRIACRILPISK